MSAAVQIALSLIACIVGAGVLGGLIGWLGEDPAKNPKNNSDKAARGAAAVDNDDPRPLFYYLLLSTGAAATVPLFLTLLQSKICDTIFSTSGDFKLQDWFVFFGLCVLASIFAKKYLQTLYDKMLERLEKTDAKLDKTARTANQAKDRLDEKDENSPKVDAALKARLHLGALPKDLVQELTQDATATQVTESTTPPPGLSEAEKKIFAALHDPAYPLGRRSFGGIVSGTELDQQTVQAALEMLKTKGLVEEVRGERTRNFYYRWCGSE